MEYIVVLMFKSMIEAPMMRPIREHSNNIRVLPYWSHHRGKNKNFKDFSRTFKDTFRIFQGVHSVQKRALSLCLF